VDLLPDRFEVRFVSAAALAHSTKLSIQPERSKFPYAYRKYRIRQELKICLSLLCYSYEYKNYTKAISTITSSLKATTQ
jgi:hypothetical protein